MPRVKALTNVVVACVLCVVASACKEEKSAGVDDKSAATASTSSTPSAPPSADATTPFDATVPVDTGPRDVGPVDFGPLVDAGPHVDVTLTPSNGDLPTQLKAEAAKAKAKSLSFYAELRADWCGPCLALEGSMNDPRMNAAFGGTYVVHLDVDAWGMKNLIEGGLVPHGIPAFYEIDADGKTTGRVLAGGAWPENVPEKMAPVLDAFFHPPGAAATKGNKGKAP